jgi:inorganic triphosphatase YgiF
MEIEKKFHIHDRADFKALHALTTLGPYTLQHPAEPEQQHNTYYDTPDGALQKQRYGLRIRRTPGHAVATLKGSEEVQDGMFRRNEWELETDDPHPASWPPGEARDAAQALLGNAPLRPLLDMHTSRHAIIAYRAGQAIAEISLDDVTIHAGGPQTAFVELEIEVLPAGSESDVQAIEEALRDHIALVPEDRSKLQRGLELLHTAH